MKKRFNITGSCIAEKHYMVDISENLKEIFLLIKEGFYFTINRPRQFGKTTTLFNIEKLLLKKDDYIVSSISFEGIGDAVFKDEYTFSPFIFKKIGEGFFNESIKEELYKASNNVKDIDSLSMGISSFIKKINKKVVLMIDEVDKSSNNQLFLSFIGMLRNKYLLRDQGKDYTFQSVILAGLHDVKNLKLKLRPDAEQKFNSPWNIATEFKVDLSFDPKEIGTMLLDYSQDKKIEMDIPLISERIYHYTSGYPFLVSRICKEIDEEILQKKNENSWTIHDIDKSVKVITEEANTNFESMVKNLENNKELYNLVQAIILGYRDYKYVAINPLINIGITYGILDKNNQNKIIIHNKIFEEVFTDYIVSKIQTDSNKNFYNLDIVQSAYIKPDGGLDFEKVLLKFQEVIKEKYSQSEVLKSNEFLEKDLRLLFLVFLKPIINGIGFSFKEVETGEEKRLDIVVIFNEEKFVVELKLWRGIEYHKQGIFRLKEYMKKEGVQKGFMLIMDKTRHKEFFVENEEGMMMVWI